MNSISSLRGPEAPLLRKPQLLLQVVLFTIIFIACVLSARAAETPRLKAAFTTNGLSSLKWGNQELLGSGNIEVSKVLLRTAGGKAVLNAARPTTEFNKAKNRLTLQFPWGNVACVYAVKADRLMMTVTVANTSEDTLDEITLKLADLKLPGKLEWPALYPNDFGYLMAPRSRNNVQGPALLPVKFNGGMLVYCNELPTPPATVELNGQDGNLGVNLGSGDGRMVYDEVYLHRPLAPGKTDQYQVSLRLAPAESNPLVVARDVCQAHAKAFPTTVKWPDRRPLVWMFPAGGDPKPDPIEWVGNAPKVRAPGPVDPEFRASTMAKTDGIIAAAKSIDAQGVIIWEIEGTSVPSVTYVGDPRLTGWLNPKMDAVADEMFRKMRDAGLRYGVCLRPSRVVYNKETGHFYHTYVNAEDPFAELDAKLEYAQKRWGCTLFYIDTPGVVRPRVNNPEPTWGVISPNDWRRLSEKHPDVLLVPEFGTPQTYAYSAPYSELRMGSLGSCDLVRTTWPTAFGVLSRQDDDAVERHEIFVRDTMHGDVILGHAGDPRIQAGINHARAEATLLKAGAPVLPRNVSKLTALLTSPNAKIRFFAAQKLGEIKAIPAVGALIKQLNDKDWLARKSAVVALGELGDPSAVAPLGALLKDRTTYIDWIAVRALVKIGKPSISVLLENIRNAETQTAMAAVWGLGEIGDSTAATSMAELLKDRQGDFQVRRRSIDSLGKLGGDAAIDALVTTLQDRNLRTLAANQLGKFNNPRAIQGLQEALDKEKTASEPDRDFLRALNNALANRPK